MVCATDVMLETRQGVLLGQTVGPDSDVQIFKGIP